MSLSDNLSSLIVGLLGEIGPSKDCLLDRWIRGGDSGDMEGEMGLTSD